MSNVLIWIGFAQYKLLNKVFIFLNLITPTLITKKTHFKATVYLCITLWLTCDIYGSYDVYRKYISSCYISLYVR